MKGIKLFLLCLVVCTMSCTTQKIMPEATMPAEAKAVEKKVEEPKAIVVKEEKFSAAEGEEQSFVQKRYYVILGSFGVYDNAKNFKNELMQKNFFPGILVNESGLYRVCVESFDEEMKARERIASIRTTFDEYSDVWLLIKKED